jgi:acyl carrier protein
MSVVSDALTFDAFAGLLLSELELTPIPLTHDTRLAEDLAFDSVLTFEMLLVVEEWIGVMLPEALIGQLKTVGDVYAVYRSRVGAR